MKSIVNISMPVRCPCELAVDNNGWFSPCFAYHGIPAREKEFDRCVQNGTRPDWCPIERELVCCGECESGIDFPESKEKYCNSAFHKYDEFCSEGTYNEVCCGG